MKHLCALEHLVPTPVSNIQYLLLYSMPCCLETLFLIPQASADHQGKKYFILDMIHSGWPSRAHVRPSDLFGLFRQRIGQAYLSTAVSNRSSVIADQYS